MLLQMMRDAINKAVTIYTHLSTYLSSTRCAKIDNLDAAISSRAAASSALSTAQWTNALAAILGNTIQTSIIRSIQTGHAQALVGGGTLGYRVTVSIGYVETTRSIVLVQSVLSASNGRNATCIGMLSSPTTLLVDTLEYGNSCQWTVVEFK